MRDELIVLGVAFAVALVTTPLVRRLSLAVGAVDQPDERRVHQVPTPRLGGLALFAGVLAAVGVGALLPGFADVFATTHEPEAVVLASLVIVAVGVLDDLGGISPPAKVAGQILAAGVLVLFGVLLRFVWIPGDPGTLVYLSFDVSALVSIAAIVIMINAVNLVDGLDGLAAGIVAIAATALLAYVHLAEATRLDLATAAPLLLTAVIGACAGFLVFNFHPASIFMGDTGAMLLGLLLAAAAISALQPILTPTRSDVAAVTAPVLVPVLVLAVPFVDTVWTILRRLATGRGVFSPDKLHLHHRLIGIGHSHRRAVLIMYYWSALLAFAGVGSSLFPWQTVALVLAAGVALAVLTWAYGGRGRGLLRRRNFVRQFTKSPPSSRQQAADLRKRTRQRL